MHHHELYAEYKAKHEVAKVDSRKRAGSPAAPNKCKKFGSWIRSLHTDLFNAYYKDIWLNSPELWDKPYEDNIDTSKFDIANKDVKMFDTWTQGASKIVSERNAFFVDQTAKVVPTKPTEVEEEEEIFPTSNWTTL
jgi:hypothetical protein